MSVSSTASTSSFPDMQSPKQLNEGKFKSDISLLESRGKKEMKKNASLHEKLEEISRDNISVICIPRLSLLSCEIFFELWVGTLG